MKYFRFSIDDCILCFKDLNDNKNKYLSIFDNDFLKNIRDLHRKYNIMVVLNMFYETSNLRLFKTKIDHFDLSMMTDKYKQEFISNSSWLKLAFHYRKEYPKDLYHGDVDSLINDVQLFNKQVVRFAGKQSLINHATIHYGILNKEQVKALKEKCSYDYLSGIFTIVDGKRIVSYHLSKDIVPIVGKNNHNSVYFDKETKVAFSKINLIANFYSNTDDAAKALEPLLKKNYLEIMTHEQYFYSNYKNYIPEYMNILYSIFSKLISNNYKSCFLSLKRKWYNQKEKQI